MNEEKRPLPVQLPITVKTYDIDFAHIVHNMVYMRWLEDLRLQILAETCPGLKTFRPVRMPQPFLEAWQAAQ